MDVRTRLIGLCVTCEFRRNVEGARSTFYMCERSHTDARFPRYPPLPVLRCDGYRERPHEPEEPPESR